MYNYTVYEIVDGKKIFRKGCVTRMETVHFLDTLGPILKEDILVVQLGHANYYIHRVTLKPYAFVVDTNHALN